MPTFVRSFITFVLLLPILSLSIWSSAAHSGMIQRPDRPSNYNKPPKAAEPSAISENLSKKVFNLALKAYKNAKEDNITQSPLLTIIDYSKPSNKPRFWVIDVRNNKVLYELTVAHGVNSGLLKTNSFSNVVNSRQSSLGVFVTRNSYYGKNGYSLRMSGLEKGFNDNAMRRAIVIHGGKYASSSFLRKYGRLGRSWGCPVLDPVVNKDVINTIKGGTLLFAYYPDSSWLKNSDFLT